MSPVTWIGLAGSHNNIGLLFREADKPAEELLESRPSGPGDPRVAGSGDHPGSRR